MIHGTLIAAICGVLLIVYLARRKPARGVWKPDAALVLDTSNAMPTVTAQDSTAPSVIVYGDAFANDSPRSQQETARRLISTACGTVSVADSYRADPAKPAPKKRSPRKVKK